MKKFIINLLRWIATPIVYVIVISIASGIIQLYNDFVHGQAGDGVDFFALVIASSVALFLSFQVCPSKTLRALIGVTVFPVLIMLFSVFDDYYISDDYNYYYIINYVAEIIGLIISFKYLLGGIIKDNL
jgi:hypothetical protein